MTESLSSIGLLADYERIAINYGIVELIMGDIIVTPPPSIEHQRIAIKLSSQLSQFVVNTDYEVFSAPIGLKIENNQVFEPDVVVVKSRGSYSDHYIIGIPSLIIEILSPSTKHRDYGVKMHNYYRYGIKEYWIVDVENQFIEIYVSGDKKYLLKNKTDLDDEITKSVNLDFTFKP